MGEPAADSRSPAGPPRRLPARRQRTFRRAMAGAAARSAIRRRKERQGLSNHKRRVLRTWPTWSRRSRARRFEASLRRTSPAQYALAAPARIQPRPMPATKRKSGQRGVALPARASRPQGSFHPSIAVLFAIPRRSLAQFASGRNVPRRERSGAARLSRASGQPNFTRLSAGSGPPGNWARRPPTEIGPRSMPKKPSRSISAPTSAFDAASSPE